MSDRIRQGVSGICVGVAVLVIGLLVKAANPDAGNPIAAIGFWVALISLGFVAIYAVKARAARP